MSVTMDDARRRWVKGYIRLLRLPVTVAERLLGHTDGLWPVTIRADRAEATATSVAGTLLRDDALKADAQLQRTAAEERARAAKLQAEAAEVRAETEVREEAALDDAAERAAAKRARVRAAADQHLDLVEEEATAARRAELEAEAQAVREQRAAAEAKAEVLDLEDEVVKARAARKRG